MEDVEEARYFVEEATKNDIDVEETGEAMDAEKHKEDIECQLEGIEEDEEYRHLDPEGLKELDIPAASAWLENLNYVIKMFWSMKHAG